MHHNAKQRQAILETLYAVREAQPEAGWLAEAELKNAFKETNITFSLSILIELGYVKRQTYKLNITGAGVLACENGIAIIKAK